jgi:hypothetical protein
MDVTELKTAWIGHSRMRSRKALAEPKSFEGSETFSKVSEKTKAPIAICQIVAECLFLFFWGYS